jgi:hypothetical protein
MTLSSIQQRSYFYGGGGGGGVESSLCNFIAKEKVYFVDDIQIRAICVPLLI